MNETVPVAHLFEMVTRMSRPPRPEPFEARSDEDPRRAAERFAAHAFVVAEIGFDRQPWLDLKMDLDQIRQRAQLSDWSACARQATDAAREHAGRAAYRLAHPSVIPAGGAVESHRSAEQWLRRAADQTFVATLADAGIAPHDAEGAVNE